MMSPRVRFTVSFLAGALSLFRGQPAAGEPADPTADAHFKRALALVDRGEIDRAISEFEAAIAVHPHFSVLYDLGQAYGLASRPVEARDTLCRYLNEGGARIDEVRRRQVQETIAFYDRLLGQLVVTAPPGSSISVDGKPIIADAPVRVRAGRHGVSARTEHGTSLVQTVDVVAGKTTTLLLAEPPSAMPAWIAPRCDVPDVTLTVDEVAAGSANEGPRPVAPGRHRLVFSREDYDEQAVLVDLASSKLTFVACDLRRRTDLPPDRSGDLALSGLDPRASVWVDDVPYHGERLPLGAHNVSAALDGFRPWSGLIVTASGTNTLSIALEPTAQSVRGARERSRNRRTWAVVSGGVGLATSVVAAGLFAARARQISSWRADRAALSQDLADAPATRAELERAGALQQRAADIQRSGDAAIVLELVSGSLIAVSIGLLLAANTHQATRTHTQKVSFGVQGISF
jgi:hypothetical protein